MKHRPLDDFENYLRRKLIAEDQLSFPSVRAAMKFYYRTMTPLHGTKTHPLSAHARECLAEIAAAPVTYGRFNAGVVDRLLRGNFVEVVQLPSPFKKDKGGNCRHLQITEEGKAEL